MSEIYIRTKNYKKAYENYVLFKELNDSIFNEENIKKITGLEYQYEFDKKKQAIELKQQENDAIRAEEEKQQKIILNSFIWGFGLMLILVIVMFRNFQQKGKANSMLSLQKEKIEKSYNKIKLLNATQNKFFTIIAHDLFADKNMILTVLRNLISNAIKFTSKKGSVTVGCKQLNEKTIEVFVADTRVGISKINISKLFSLEHDSKTTGTENENGTGLGLLLCKEFIEIHNSELIIESEPEKGSRFSFILPLS